MFGHWYNGTFCVEINDFHFLSSWQVTERSEKNCIRATIMACSWALACNKVSKVRECSREDLGFLGREGPQEPISYTTVVLVTPVFL